MGASGEWIRLPGLFLWDEVCDLFAEEAGRDDTWRFAVLLDAVGADDAPLYVVHAAPGWRARDRRAVAPDASLPASAKL